MFKSVCVCVFTEVTLGISSIIQKQNRKQPSLKSQNGQVYEKIYIFQWFCLQRLQTCWKNHDNNKDVNVKVSEEQLKS